MAQNVVEDLAGKRVHLVYRSSGPALCGLPIAEVDAQYSPNAPACQGCLDVKAQHAADRYREE